jgi:hypothetical protein
VAWPEPELDVGDDDGLLRPLLELLELLELEPELDEPEPDVPEPDVPELVEPVLVEPELPVLPLLAELPDVDEFELVDAAPVVEPGSARATAPAASTLATPTVAVVVVIRPRPRCRAVTARVTVSRFGLFIVEVSPLPLGGAY